MLAAAEAASPIPRGGIIRLGRGRMLNPQASPPASGGADLRYCLTCLERIKPKQREWNKARGKKALIHELQPEFIPGAVPGGERSPSAHPRLRQQFSFWFLWLGC